MLMGEAPLVAVAVWAVPCRAVPSTGCTLGTAVAYHSRRRIVVVVEVAERRRSPAVVHRAMLGALLQHREARRQQQVLTTEQPQGRSGVVIEVVV